MQSYPPLLRRPLPPKLPKLHLYIPRRVYKAKTEKIKPTHVKIIHHETTSAERDKRPILDVSRNQSPFPVSIQNILLDYHVEERVTTISVPKKFKKRVTWHLPGTITTTTTATTTAATTTFLPDTYSTSTKVTRQKTSQIRSSRLSTEEPSKPESISMKNVFMNLLVFSSTEPKFSNVPPQITTPKHKEVPQITTPKHKEVFSRYHLSEGVTDDFKQSLATAGAIVPHPPLRTTPTKPTRKWFEPVVPARSTTVLKMTTFSGFFTIPTAIIPRKPHIKPRKESYVTDDFLRKQSKALQYEVATKFRKRQDTRLQSMRSEGVRIVAATQDETIVSMINLAIANCQMHERNALILKAFFITNCPDLTPLALQLVYIDLSYNYISSFPTQVLCVKHLQVLILRNNPIKEIPSTIEQLRFLRIFNIAFNLITTFPLGLLSLSYLEKLDVSYNDITYIPNEIQKLRSLRKLSIIGNDLTSFPPGILKLNLKKILFENNYTHLIFWKDAIFNNPQKLIHLTSMLFLKKHLYRYYDVIPEEIQKLLICESRCEWCLGPKFGEGFRIIQFYDIFGATNVPVLFHVCSSSCYRKVKETANSR